MHKVELGNTGLMVSEVAFGGIPIQRLDSDQAVSVVQRCLDLEVDFLDTAHAYGTSEERIGRAIAGRRDDVTLASKATGRDAETFREQMETSFRQLGVDYIELYQCHNVSTAEAYERVISPGGALEVAQEAKSKGRIGHIGLTSHKLEMAIEAARSGLFESIMFPFNYIAREANEELIPLCREKGVGFMAMKPMGGGYLDDAALSFKYLRQFSGVVPVVGIERQAEIKEIVSIVESRERLSEEEQAAIARIREELGSRFCRGCGYCQPCTQDIAISFVMRIQSLTQRFPEEQIYGEWGQSMVAKAETCVDCGECEPRCPYELPIREIMTQNAAWYNEQMALRQRA